MTACPVMLRIQVFSSWRKIMETRITRKEIFGNRFFGKNFSAKYARIDVGVFGA